MEEQEEKKVPEVGVRMTRAAALKQKKRPLIQRELSFSSPLKYSCKKGSAMENSISPPVSEKSNDQPSTPSFNEPIASCYSTQIVREEDEASSVEISTYNLKMRESKEFESERAELENTTARPSEANSFRQSTEMKMMPSEAELEDFFSKAEKDLHKQFAEKYNFDFVKEEPLEGRYEWVPVTGSQTSPSPIP